MTQALAESAGVEAYLAQFARFEEKQGGDWFSPIRRAAMERFIDLGFPTNREESWRNTSLTPLTKISFSAPDGDGDATKADWVEELLFKGLEAHRLEFINGRFSPERSGIGALPASVCVMSLAEALTSERERLQHHLTKLASEFHPLVALNTAFLEDGAFIYIPKGVRLDRPVHLLFSTCCSREPVRTHPRVLVIVEEGAEVKLIESYAGPKGEVYFTNGVTEVVVGKNASVDHYKIQRESEGAFHIGVSQADIARDARYRNFSISFGARLSRHEIGARLAGENIRCTLNGLYMAGGQQHVDHHTKLDHAMPNCESHELYKGILSGRATGVFTGKIHVHPDAQKTDANQSNRALLLSPDATVDSQPQLEIYANDVKCMHGASIGQLDEEAVFYLRSRGIPEKEAIGLLTFAFANEVVEQIDIEGVHNVLEELIYERLHEGKLIEGQ